MNTKGFGVTDRKIVDTKLKTYQIVALRDNQSCKTWFEGEVNSLVLNTWLSLSVREYLISIIRDFLVIIEVETKV